MEGGKNRETAGRETRASVCRVFVDVLQKFDNTRLCIDERCERVSASIGK